MLIVGLKRYDVLIQRGPLARDIILVEPDVLILRSVLIVENVFSAVRQPAVGIRIADAPVKCIAAEGVSTR